RGRPPDDGRVLRGAGGPGGRVRRLVGKIVLGRRAAQSVADTGSRMVPKIVRGFRLQHPAQLRRKRHQQAVVLRSPQKGRHGGAEESPVPLSRVFHQTALWPARGACLLLHQPQEGWYGALAEGNHDTRQAREGEVRREEG
ncbi:unnamed protein product, partial [Laminaria digitata]